jgi:hypothetical protein
MSRMRKLLIVAATLALATQAWSADKLSAPDLAALAKQHSSQLPAEIAASFAPAKTSEEFSADPAEKGKPYFRVAITSRED